MFNPYMQTGSVLGLPQNSTAPNAGGLGIGGGIYGNPFQVNQFSQPSALMQQYQQLQQQQQPLALMQQQQPLFSALQNQQQLQQPQQPQQPNMFASQERGAMLNQPMGMNYGIGALIPGYYAAQR